MEEKLKLELQQASIMEVEHPRDSGDLEFYETIEAPKFVDFTAPNHFRPDDRYWFCSRVGCNRKHEEEMDSEAIYKDFVLRVMAARSPNVRFRRALDRKPANESKKCPFSAPPKASKSRIPRLALVSSISKKLILEDEKNTIKPSPVKSVSTPKARVKHVSAKYMTSPRKKKGGSPNLNAFRSVRNPKKTSITLQKNKVVAKALLFSSPKKSAKKLAITSEKRIKAQKPSKETSSVRNILPTDASRKQPRSCKAKSRQGYLSCSKALKEKSAKASTFRCAKVQDKQHDKKHDSGALQETMSGDDSSDMVIDEKPRAGSLDVSSAISISKIEEKSDESSMKMVTSTSEKETTSSSERPETAGSSDGIFSGTLTSESVSVPDSKELGSEKQNPVTNKKQQAEDQDKENKGYTTEDDLENQIPGEIGGELLDNDDKENAPNSNAIRNVNAVNPSKHVRPEKSKAKTEQKLQTGDKGLKDNYLAAGTTQGVKYKKLKPTHPKPFRLRTNERGILKEATLEKKVNSQESSANMSENSQTTETATRENASKKAEDRSLKKVKFVKSKYRETSKEAEPKPDRGIAPCPEKQIGRTGRTKTPFTEKLVRPQRDAGAPLRSRGLNVTGNPATTTKVKESRQPNTEGAVLTQKSSVRKPTVPKEPYFHTSHRPKSCTRNIQ